MTTVDNYGNFNSTTNGYNLTELNLISLVLLRNQKISFILWILFSGINLIGSALIFAVIVYWKPLHNPTNYLVANLAVSEVIFSINVICVATYHEYYIYFDIPEVIIKSECFAICCVLLCTHSMNGLLYLAISCDRFVASIFPIYYKNRKPIINKTVVGLLWVFCLIFIIFAYIYRNAGKQSPEDELLPLCLPREIMSDLFYKIYLYMLLLSNLSSVLLYAFLIVVLKMKLILSKTDNSSVANIRRRMTNKVTQSLAVNSVIHFLTVTLAASASLAVANMPYRGAAISAYVSLPTLFDGTTHFVVLYICQTQFKEGVLHTFRKLGFIKGAATNANAWATKSAASTAGASFKLKIATTV